MFNYLLYVYIVQVLHSNLLVQSVFLNPRDSLKDAANLQPTNLDVQKPCATESIENNANRFENNYNHKKIQKRDLSLPTIPKLPSLPSLPSVPSLPSLPSLEPPHLPTNTSITDILPKPEINIPKIPILNPITNKDNLSRRKRGAKINDLNWKQKSNYFLKQDKSSRARLPTTEIGTLLKTSENSKYLSQDHILSKSDDPEERIPFQGTTLTHDNEQLQKADITKIIQNTRFSFPLYENRLDFPMNPFKEWNIESEEIVSQQDTRLCPNENNLKHAAEFIITISKAVLNQKKIDELELMYQNICYPQELLTLIYNVYKEIKCKYIKRPTAFYNIETNKNKNDIAHDNNGFNSELSMSDIQDENSVEIKQEKLKEIAAMLADNFKNIVVNKNINVTKNNSDEVNQRNLDDTQLDESKELVMDYDDVSEMHTPATSNDVSSSDAVIYKMKSINRYFIKSGINKEYKEYLKNLFFQSFRSKIMIDDSHIDNGMNQEMPDQFILNFEPSFEYKNDKSDITMSKLGSHNNYDKPFEKLLHEEESHDKDRSKRYVSQKQSESTSGETAVDDAEANAIDSGYTGITNTDTSVKKTKDKRDENSAEVMTTPQTSSTTTTTTTTEPTTTATDNYEEVTAQDYPDEEETCPTDIIKIILNALRCLLNSITSALFGVEFGSGCCN